MNKEQITSTQVTMLIFLIIITTVILYVPGITAQRALQSAWIVPISASIFGFITLWTVLKLYKRFPRQTLPQLSEIILGKAIGKVLASGYFLFFLIANVLIIREFSDFLTGTVLFNTPGLALNLTIVVIGGFAALKGIEVIARITQFILPIFVFISIAFLVLGAPDMDWEKLLPLFEGGIQPIVWSSVVTSSWYGEIIVLMMLLPKVNKPQEVMGKGAWMLLALAGYLCLETLVTLAVLGPKITGHLLFPFWFLARNIELGNLHQRLEFYVQFIWICGIVVKVALFYYITFWTATQVFELKPTIFLFFFLGIIQAMAATFPFVNSLELREILALWWPPFGLFFELVLPLTLLLLAIIRNKRGVGSNET